MPVTKPNTRASMRTSHLVRRAIVASSLGISGCADNPPCEYSQQVLTPGSQTPWGSTFEEDADAQSGTWVGYLEWYDSNAFSLSSVSGTEVTLNINVDASVVTGDVPAVDAPSFCTEQYTTKGEVTLVAADGTLDEKVSLMIRRTPYDGDGYAYGQLSGLDGSISIEPSTSVGDDVRYTLSLEWGQNRQIVSGELSAVVDSNDDDNYVYVVELASFFAEQDADDAA